jgi:sodium transport system ATP-binding protein
MIEIHDVAKRFVSGHGAKARTVQAVDGVSFTAHDARITGLLGPNGAGKTTTLRMLAGLIEPDRGRLTVDRLDVHTNARQALARMGMLSDARGLYARLTARENILYYARLQGMQDTKAHARIDELADVLEMQDLLERRTDGFSQGERMKTALARALVHDPQNIVDVMATRALRHTLRRLRDEQGKCIVFSSHIMQEVERLCDHVVLVAQGHTMAQGTVAELNAKANEVDFEETFVKLALAPRAAPTTTAGVV